MQDKAPELEDRGAVSRTLAIGVGLSAALIAAGLLRAAFAPEAQAWLRAGIFVLVATPYLRVLQMAAIFARRREWRFLALAFAVFALMSLGVALGLRG